MNQLNQKRLFITGAAGFIGFHLSSYRSQRGDQVIGYDNFNNYYEPLLKTARAAKLRQMGVEVVEGDINDSFTLKQTIENFQPTHIIHLAAQAGVRYSIDNPQAYVKSNVEGFVNVLEMCRHFQLPLIYASSSSVYGNNQKIPFSEDDRTDAQASIYGVTKKSNELMAQTYHHLYGIPVTGLRFFTVYGPWGRPDMAYFSFTKAILAGQPIQVYNQGEMQRDFTYIDDIVAGIACAIDKSYACEIFNLGNHRPEKLSFLIETIENCLGLQAKSIFLPMQSGDVVTTYADISKSRHLLDFNPITSLETGITHFINWYKNFFLV